MLSKIWNYIASVTMKNCNTVSVLYSLFGFFSSFVTNVFFGEDKLAALPILIK